MADLEELIERVSDADAMIALFAYNRCRAMAETCREPVLRELWAQDARSAWGTLMAWKEGLSDRQPPEPLSQPDLFGDAA